MSERLGTTDTETNESAGEIRTVSFVSLGCPKNLVDSEKMLGVLAEHGIAPVSSTAGENREDLSVAGSEQDTTAVGESSFQIDRADAVVINTCGFLEASKQESLGVVDAAVKAKERGEIKRVVVAGCLVQRHRAKMLEWAPGIDAMLGVYDREKILDAVRGKRPERKGLDDQGELAPFWISKNAKDAAADQGRDVVGLTIDGKRGTTGLGYYESDAGRLRLTPRHYAYLRISEGCNQACAFCTIPSIRGRMRSKRTQDILNEGRELLRDGAFELMLIGQDTTSYGEDIGLVPEGQRSSGLAQLLEDLDHLVREETSAGWLRLMYAYPTTFDERTVDRFAEIASRGRLLPYIDIPLQHASDNLLDRMRRRVTADQQLKLMQLLREQIPGMAIRTTFISGFPGETEEDHEHLLEFIDEVGFDAVGVFTYSPEPSTPAGKMH
ncbi:MAG: radical SAM protein, partial [Planctomycetota bacterium]